MLELFQNITWGWHVLLLIVSSGIHFTVKSGFFQIRNFFFWIKTSLVSPDRKKTGKGKGEITQFQSITTALAGSIGTGNIVGVASAITIGGPGAVFWMWISALFGMMTVFAENMLSAKYKNASGALGYIEKIKKIGKPLACIYAFGCFLSSLGMGNMIQTNSIASVFMESGIPSSCTAVALGIIIFFIARGGLSLAAKVTDKLVPLMTGIFFISSIIVLCKFNGKIPDALNEIISGAFSLKAGSGGVAGALIAAKTGISRGIFTNESGLGSSAFAYEGLKNHTPMQIGCMGIFQVFVDTIVMCTITSLCILCCYNPNLDGANLTIYAFEKGMGSYGRIAISACTVLFAFATTTAWCCYGRESLFYLTKGKGKNVYALIAAVFAAAGCILPLNSVFAIGDAFNGLMAIPNILALFYFSSEINTSTIHPSIHKKKKALSYTRGQESAIS